MTDPPNPAHPDWPWKLTPQDWDHVDESLTDMAAGPHSTTLVDPNYSRVCGRVRGYQFGLTQTFVGAPGINTQYVYGVSLTHGPSNSRTHIWTFASGLSEVYRNSGGSGFCPCVTATAQQPPAFVGNDYFCESGLHTAWVRNQYRFYPDDPLWDGQNCVSSSCCQLNNPPYFTKTLPAPTSDNIELRICSLTSGRNGDTPIDQVELYVQ